jgi:hypothetical protein
MVNARLKPVKEKLKWVNCKTYGVNLQSNEKQGGYTNYHTFQHNARRYCIGADLVDRPRNAT